MALGNKSEIADDNEGMVVDEELLYDLEDKKVLNKRKKRTLKVEECN
jgi:hypothetical protein